MPELVAVDAAQPVTFVNRDDVTHRIVKVSGPGRSFRSEPLEPGERYRLSLLGKPGLKLREGTVVYRSTGPGRPSGRIAVKGKLLPRPDDPPERPPEWATAPERPSAGTSGAATRAPSSVRPETASRSWVTRGPDRTSSYEAASAIRTAGRPAGGGRAKARAGAPAPDRSA